MSYPFETQAALDQKPQTDLATRKFQRKPFAVEGVQVTKENFEDVAAWCGGSVVTVQDPSQGDESLFPSEPKRYIQVEVSRPLSKRQTEAYIGDWVLFASRGFKVYGNRPFLKNFEELSGDLAEA